MQLEGHHHLFHRRVAGALADAVDGGLHLACAVEHAAHGVGRGHAQVVVAVGREDAPSGGEGVHVLVEILDLLAVLIGGAETGRVGDVAHGGAGLGHGLDHAGQILVVGASGVFGVELHVLHILLGVLHGSHGPLDDLLGGRVELVADVALAGADAGVDALVLGILQRLGGHVDVFLHGARQGAYRGPRHGLRDLHHAVEVARTRDGEAGFYHIHAEGFQLTGHLNLFYGVQLATGDLFAITQCGVKNEQSVTHVGCIFRFLITQIAHKGTSFSSFFPVSARKYFR